jgi:nitrogen regulatory protein PII
MARDVVVLTDVELITCIVQKGEADKIVKAAYNAGAQGATIYYAKGSGVKEKLGVFGVAVDSEKEIINMAVPSEMVNVVFDAMYLAGELDTPGKGFIYVTNIEKAGTYIPKEVLEKLEKNREVK